MGAIIALASLALTLAGVVAAMYFGTIGTRASKRQERQERADHDWQLKHEKVAVQIARINPRLIVAVPGTQHQVILYQNIFKSPELRERIETYIVQLVDSRTRFAVRKPTQHELRSPTLRQTVTEVAASLDTFVRENPGMGHHLRG